MKCIKRKLTKWLLRDTFASLVEEDVVPLASLTQSQQEALAKQAKLIMETDYWKRLMHSMRYKAQKQMFISSTNWDDVIVPKSILYVLDVQQKRMKKDAARVK